MKFTQLPSEEWKGMPWWASGIIKSFLSVTPDMHISFVLEGKIIRDSTGMQMSFKDNSIYLGENLLGYTGYLKSIFAFDDPQQNKGNYLSIEIEHNLSSSLVPKKGRIDHQMLADIISINLFPEPYT